MNAPAAQSVRNWLIQQGPAMAFDVLAFLIILLVGWMIVGISRRLVNRSIQRSERVNDLLRTFAVDITGKVIWVIVFMIALGQLGINIGPLIAGLGVVGFVLGFAFKDSLGNLASGVMILLNNPFDVGDYVEVTGQSGTIQNLNLMATVMTTPDNKRVTLPNSSVWGSSIVNYSAMDTRRVDMVFGIGYDDDIGEALEIVNRILDENDRVLPDPEPTVAVKELADSSVNFVVRPWVNTADYWAVYFDITRAVKEAFDEAGVQIPYPQLDVHHHELPAGPSSA